MKQILHVFATSAIRALHPLFAVLGVVPDERSSVSQPRFAYYNNTVRLESVGSCLSSIVPKKLESATS